MPRGSQYQGPAEALERYAAVVDGSSSAPALKGAKNPYTAHKGHMFSFLDSDGQMAIRLPDDLRDEFVDRYDSGPVLQYGAVMRGYASVPQSLLESPDELIEWFDKSYAWIDTLDPK